MDKVMCIKQGKWNGDFTAAPVFGEVCTVLTIYEDDDGVYYQLKHYPFDEVYNSANFAPLSDIDETTFEREALYQQNFK